MHKDRRVLLFLSMLILFALWLGSLIFWVFPHALANLKDLDPMMGLITGLGIGGVTNFFIMVLTLGWQFFYRKAGTPRANTPGAPSG